MDQTLEVTIPSHFFNAILVVNSILLWGAGAAYMILGLMMYHILNNLYIGTDGLYRLTGFLMLGIVFGIVAIAISFATNYVIIYPSSKRYGILCLLYLGIIAVITIHYATGKQSPPILGRSMKKGIIHVMHNYNAESVLNTHLNAIQRNMECCGTHNYTAWFNTSWANGEEKVPPSCCKSLSYCHNLRPLVVSDIHEKGCFKPVEAFVLILDVAQFSMFLGIIMTQIASTICTLVLSIRHIKMFQMLSLQPFVE